MKNNSPKNIQNLALLIISLLISLACAELGVRQLEYQPYILRTIPDQKIEISSELYTSHPILGYTHLPGVYTITFHDVYTVRNTHLDNTLRITHPLASYDYEFNKDEIWIFGGSFTYGWSIDDAETFPWLVQEQLPEYEVVNFGVNGYGTVHSFLQFKETLKTRKKPIVVIVIYANFHDERNAFSRGWRKRIFAYDSSFRQKTYPYALFDGKGNIIYRVGNIEYTPLPLMDNSALVNLVDEAYIALEDYFSNKKSISKGVLKDFANLAQEQDTVFVLAGIVPKAQEMLEYMEKESILTVDISVDLSLVGNRNLPYDAHPSAKANQQYAQNLIVFLKEKLQIQ